jgi:hypothetical protein
MITTKLFEEFQSCLEKSIQEIKEPKNDYEKLLLEFNGFLKNELLCVEISECEISTNELVSILYGDEDGYNIFHFTYHHEYNQIMFLERDDNNGFHPQSNPAYEEIRENIYRLKQS